MIELTNAMDETSILKKDAKSTRSYIQALMKMIKEVKASNPIRYLTGDQEKAFASRFTQDI